MRNVSEKANIYRGKHAVLCTMNDLEEINNFNDPSSKISSK